MNDKEIGEQPIRQMIQNQENGKIIYQQYEP